MQAAEQHNDLGLDRLLGEGSLSKGEAAAEESRESPVSPTKEHSLEGRPPGKEAIARELDQSAQDQSLAASHTSLGSDDPA